MDLGMGVLMGFFIGLAISFLLSIVLSKMKSGDDAAQLKQKEAEHGVYRKQVDDHFINTAVLLKGLTEQYRDVYQHIAQGAGELCSEEAKALQTADLAETALLAKPVAVEAVDEEAEVVEPTSNNEATQLDNTDDADIPLASEVDKENGIEPSSDDDDIPLASEVEMSSDIAEELKNQANKKVD